MELGPLRALVTVAEVGTFTRAAERLGLSQPSLSQQIINLEKEVGHKLFHRLGRKAVLTEAGSVLFQRARRILAEVEDASRELTDSPSLERRILVGAIPTLATYLLPTLVKRCKDRFPNLQVDIREDFRSDLVHGIIEGELDLAIIALPVEDPRLSVEPLLIEPLLLVVSKRHPFAGRDEVSNTELADQNFIMLGSSSSLAAQVRSFCGDHHFEPKIGYRCAQVATVKGLVGIGAGISILPRMARNPEDDKTLAYVELKEGMPVREVAVCRHLQRYQSRGSEQFLTVLREVAQEIGAAS